MKKGTGKLKNIFICEFFGIFGLDGVNSRIIT